MKNRIDIFKVISLAVSITVTTNCLKAQSIGSNWDSLFYQSYYKGFRDFPPLRNHWLELSETNNVDDFEPLSYGLDAILAMFESTDNVSYLDDAIFITSNVMDSSQITDQISGNRSVLKDNYRGWVEKGNNSSVYPQEIPLSEVYFFEYVARLLKDIHNNSAINNIQKYQDFYFQTLNFLETNIWDKWENRGIRYNKNKYRYLFLSRAHMASHWAYIAAELSFLTKDKDRRKDYLEFVDLYNRSLENNFKKYDDYIMWNQTWDTLNPDVTVMQDVSHANLVVSYIVEAYGLGLWKDEEAIKRLINTVKYKLWDPNDCLFKDNLDGTFFENVTHSSIGSFQADGFVKLTRFDSSLFSIYGRFINCSQYLTLWYQYGQLFANLALSQKVINKTKLD